MAQHKQCPNCKSAIRREDFMSDASFRKAKFCSRECALTYRTIYRRDWKRKRKYQYGEHGQVHGRKEMLKENLKCEFEKCNRRAISIFNNKSYCSEHFKEVKKEWIWNGDRYVNKRESFKARVRKLMKNDNQR